MGAADTVRVRLARRLRDAGAGWISGEVLARELGVRVRSTKRSPYRRATRLGRDLQFIRINGTLVGGLVGVVIHAVTLAVS